MSAAVCEKCAQAGERKAAHVLLTPCASSLVCSRRRGCDCPLAVAPLRLCAVECPHLGWDVLSTTTNSVNTTVRARAAAGGAAGRRRAGMASTQSECEC
jgi:hypothetical protein